LIRRLNFTGRRRLARADVNVRLTRGVDQRLQVVVGFALGQYGLPPSAPVFVEAYRQTTWQRFAFGSVASPVATASTILRPFGSAQGVRFRVRVVEPTVSGRPPRVLAFVDDLRPVAPIEGKGGLSLLPVDWGDFDGYTWKLEIDDESGPLLLVSKTLVPDREAFVGSREFTSLVLPVMLRSVLERALQVETDSAEADGWAEDWLRLARSRLGRPPSGRGGATGPTDDEEDWIDDVVEIFSKAHGIPERFAGWWSAESS